MPAIIPLIIAAIQTAPQIEAATIAGKNFITSLVGGKVTAEQQKIAHDHIDAVCAAILAGNPPPAWTVEADPQA